MLCSLRLLTPQHSALLCSFCLLACSAHGLTHSLRSLPCGTVEIHEYVFMLRTRFTGTNAFFILTRNMPFVPDDGELKYTKIQLSEEDFSQFTISFWIKLFQPSHNNTILSYRMTEGIFSLLFLFSLFFCCFCFCFL